MRRFVSALALLALLPLAAFAQSYPTQNPTYIPSPVNPQDSIASTATFPTGQVFQLNGVGSFTVRVTGTYTGLVAEVDVTNDRTLSTGAPNNSPTWTAMSCRQAGAAAGNGQFVPSITTNGIYECNAAGYTEARFWITGLSTGTVTFTESAGVSVDRVQSNYDLGAVIPSTGAAPINVGTTNSADLYNADARGAICIFSQVSSTGSPSAIMNIQIKDAASGFYYTVLSTAAITAVGASVLEVYPGLLSTDIPAVAWQLNGGGLWLARNFHLPRVWRVQAVVTGSGGFNAAVGCNVLQ